MKLLARAKCSAKRGASLKQALKAKKKLAAWHNNNIEEVHPQKAGGQTRSKEGVGFMASTYKAEEEKKNPETWPI